jgi:GT2 family glycosyltransferase
MVGWRLGGAEAGYTLRLRSGQLNTEFFPERGVRIPRPDVLEAIGQERGFVDLDCGFMIYLPNAYSVGETTFLEVETATGAVAFKNLRVSHRRGMDAIKRILAIVDIRGETIDACFDNVVGPAVTALNRDRMRAPIEIAEVAFGARSEAPTHSIIVPLFGRVDFIEYQMAQFSRDQAARDYDIIYVLDDPPRRRELETLSLSVFERFQIPFRLLLLTRNLGFAPANNVGLKAARGKYVCFLNSDAFPDSIDWLQSLTDRLDAHPNIGVIGARLLYEDGSIQHEGCVYKPLTEFGGWTFVTHENKSRRPGAEVGLRHFPAITGACMVLRRSVINELGGFDEAYLVGDFEDSDLCMKLRERELKCAVDLNVQIFHLERKSQTSPNHNWRQNLTLYNAWVHQRRWITAPVAKTPTPILAER